MTQVVNEDLARVVATYTDGDLNDLQDADRHRLRVFLRSIWRAYETAYFSYQYGTLGPAEWSRHERLICAQRDLLTETMWRQTTDNLTPEFVDYVDGNCVGDR